MPYYITNAGPSAWNSASLSLAAGRGVVMNTVTLPVDLSPGLVSGQLSAASLDEPPLLTYDMHGYVAAGSLLGTVTQYLPLFGANVVPSATANQQIYPNRKKRIYNLQCVLAVVPGAGTSRTFTVMKNNVATALTLAFGAAVSGRQRISSLIEVDDMEPLIIKCEVTGAPAASAFAWSLTMSNSDPLI
jgi:hypothetical protein